MGIEPDLMNELARIETVIHLQGAELFMACDAEQIVRISAIAGQRRFAPGEDLFKANDTANALYCVVRGKVEIVDGAGNRTEVEAPGTVGVTEILSGRLRTHTATAIDDTLVLALESEDFFDLLANNIEIVRSLFRQLLSNH
jgi:CRP-like cAMP-binding protein